MDEAYDHYGHPRSSLACLECRRKKTRCNMRLPICGLCSRVGAVCTYPSKRKTPEPRKITDKENSVAYKKRFNQLMSVLEGRLESGADIDDLIHATEAAGKRSRAASGSLNGEEDDHDDAPRSKRTSIPDARSLVSRSSTSTSDRPVSMPACSIDIPTDVANDLVNIYFSRIQVWLPLLHRPRFIAQFMDPRTGSLKTGGRYSLEEALILNGIFALSARFSTHPYFAATPLRDRGVSFGDRARGLHDRLRVISDEATFQSLQGCILLAYCFMVEGPSHRSWILSGTCIRLLYELEIDKVDERSNILDTPLEWSYKEERRRAWWLVWELDTFGSVISQRPYNVNRKRLGVHLPVTDEAWFADSPVQSTTLAVKPAEAWMNLKNSPNQNERCWAIVSNYLLSLILEKHESKEYITREEQQEMQSVMYDFASSIPARMKLMPDATYFDITTMTRSNWVILVHLDLATAKAAIPLLDPVEQRKWLAGMPTTEGVGISLLREREISRIIGQCSPDFITTCHPFLACVLIPVPLRRLSPMSSEQEECMNREMFALVLSQYAEIWGIGAVLLYLQKLISKGEPLNAEDMAVAKRYSIFFKRDPLFQHASKQSAIPGHADLSERINNLSTQPRSYQPYAFQGYNVPSSESGPSDESWTHRYRHTDRHDSSPG